MLRDTSQSFVNVNPKTPKRSNAIDDSEISLMKKYAISARIAAARPVRPHRNTLSGKRESGDRPRTGRSPPTDREPASTQPVTGEPLQVRPFDAACDFVSSGAGSFAYWSWPSTDCPSPRP